MNQTILWIFAALGALWLVRLLYGWITQEPVERLPKPLGTSEFDFTLTLATHLDVPIIDGNKIENLRNGDEIFPSMLKAIDEAQSTVNLLTYVYWQGDVAQRFADALCNAAKRGVEVRVLLDAMGAAQMRDELARQMRRGGCRVEWFRPLRWYNLRQINGRTHRKVLVVDGSIAFTGGVGIAEEWEGNANSENEWRDDHFRITGSAALALQGCFAGSWRLSTGEVIHGHHLQEQPKTGDARVVPVFTAPPMQLSSVLFAYCLSAQAAKQRLDIATPYFVPDMGLVDAIVATAERGVRVRLLLPGDHNDSNTVRWSSLSRYPKLLDAGVEIYEFQPTMLHSKIVLVDDRWSLIGSANFDNRSIELNEEVMLMVEDAPLAEDLSTGFEQDLERSVRVDPEEFEKIAIWKKFFGWLLLIVREQL